MHKITSKIDFDTITEILEKNLKLELSEESKQAILKSRKFLDQKLAAAGEPIYGVNTGFGALHGKKISDSELEQLQTNLVMSHACGTGDEVPQEIVKLMILLKIQGLSLGYSGIQLEVVQRLVDFYNLGMLPVVYEQGSLGASGDLAPLAHLSLPLLGMGEVNYKGEKVSAEKALVENDLKPLHLKSKDGLALLNGTQFMSAFGVNLILKARKLMKQSDMISSVSLDAFDCRTEPFDSDIHKIRAHSGQITTAKNISEYRKDSELASQKKEHVQDPYSFRCIPQVHGASKDVVDYCSNVFLTEINSVTDNPLVMADENKILSGGNFHGQPLAMALDFLAIALAEIGNISERRIFQLISGQRGLPAFLVNEAGLNSGFMITQYTAASIVSMNKQLCSPSSVDSIVSSNGQEDHVSMGANAAVKCLKVAQNVQRVMGIELMVSAQALEFRRPKGSSVQIERIISDYRKQVSFLTKDRIMYSDIEASVAFLENGF